MEKLLSQEVENQLIQIFGMLKNPITIAFFGNNYPASNDTKQLLQEISHLSEKINFKEYDMEQDLDYVKAYKIQRTPSFVILDEKEAYHGVKFNGIPGGHEINSFLSALLEMSGIEAQIPDKIKERVARITKPVSIKVFVTLGCPHCPGAVQTAHRLAMLNPNIEAEMIESETFSDLAAEYQVSSVPRIFINERYDLVGNHPVEAFLNLIEKL